MTGSQLKLTHGTKKTERVMKKTVTKTEMLRRNGPVMKSAESALRPEESLWLEGFVKEVRFSRE